MSRSCGLPQPSAARLALPRQPLNYCGGYASGFEAQPFPTGERQGRLTGTRMTFEAKPVWGELASGGGESRRVVWAEIVGATVPGRLTGTNTAQEPSAFRRLWITLKRPPIL